MSRIATAGESKTPSAEPSRKSVRWASRSLSGRMRWHSPRLQ